MRHVLIAFITAAPLLLAVQPAGAQEIATCHLSLGADHVEELVSYRSAAACTQPGMQPMDNDFNERLVQHSHNWCVLTRGQAVLSYFLDPREQSSDLVPAAVRAQAIQFCEGLAVGLGYEGAEISFATNYDQ